MTYLTIPLGCIILTFEYLGFFDGRKRYRFGKKLFTWDSQHGEIEVFNKRGRHLGVINCDGVLIKDVVKGRRIDV